MVLTIKDEMQEGISFVNSTTSPAERRASSLIWNIADLEPGEVQNIDYLARAHRSGIFSVPSHIEAWESDGSRSFFADISAQVYLPGEAPEPRRMGLAAPRMLTLIAPVWVAKNWIPCVACSAAQTTEMKMDRRIYGE